MATIDNSYANMLGMQPQAAGPQIGGAVNPAVDPNQITQQLMQPPANPDEVSARTAKWTQLLQDPRLQNALMFFGASATAPLGYGESPLHRGLASAATGATAYQLTDLAGQNQQLEQREAQRRDALAGAQIEQSQAATAGTRQLIEQRGEEHPLRMRQIEQEMRRLDAQIAAAATEEQKQQLLIKKAKLETELQEKFGGALMQAEIGQRTASAGASRAAAGASTAHARLYGAQAAPLENINVLEQRVMKGEQLTPAEQQILVRGRAGRGDVASAQVLQDQYLREQIKTAFPAIAGDEAALSQKLLEFKKNQGVTLPALLKAREALTEAGADTSDVDAAIQQMVRSGGGTRSPGAPAAAPQKKVRRYNPQSGKIE